MPEPGDLLRFRQTVADLSRDIGQEGLAEILESYLAASGVRVASLRGFLDDDDLEGLGRCAHLIHGSSAIFGLTGLEAAALELELAARDPADARLPVLIADLQDRYARIEPLLRKACESSSSVGP